jgi:hypothetical protein
VKLTIWLRLREGGIADRWMQELRLSEGRQGGGSETLLERVVRYLVSFLPDCLGDSRERGLEVWERSAHLYGSLALRRGLAAGEVVEELQLLRGVILRMYLLDALSNTEGQESGNTNLHMAFLTLNRVLDMGVSRASVSYVDDLFFAHLQRSGVSEGVTDEVEGELLRLLEAFREELDC